MTKIEPQAARQGRPGYRVLMILVAALVLAAAAWFIVELYGEAISPDAPQASLVLMR